MRKEHIGSLRLQRHANAISNSCRCRSGSTLFGMADMRPSTAMGKFRFLKFARMTSAQKGRAPAPNGRGNRGSLLVSLGGSASAGNVHDRSHGTKKKDRAARERVYVVFIGPELSSAGETPVYLRRFMPGIWNDQFIWRKAVNNSVQGSL